MNQTLIGRFGDTDNNAYSYNLVTSRKKNEKLEI